MSPRPRKATDAEVFRAAGRVMSRVGPAQLSMSEIAREAGVTPSALSQRFGSRHGLLLAMNAHAAAEAPEHFEDLRARHASPLAALRAYANTVACLGESPGMFAHHLAYLQLDLSEPDFHPHMRAQAEAARRAIHAMLQDAVAAGELIAATETAGLARTTQALLSGSLMTWAFFRDGPAPDWVAADLESILRPWLAPKP
ncbi:MAG TPA: helix-turn-helix domain-containing protein [Longimicrobium sp.]